MTKTTKAEKATKTTKAAPKVELTPEQQAALVKPPEGAVPSGAPQPAGDTIHPEPEGPKVESIVIKLKLNEMTTIPKRVFAHEVAILQTLHGEENVALVEGSEQPKKIQSTVGEEYARLLRAYGRKGAKAVQTVYPSAALLADELGLSRPTRTRATKLGLEPKQQSAQRGEGAL